MADVKMINPDGVVGTMPEANVAEAVQNGYLRHDEHVQVTNPKGVKGWMPKENLPLAVKNGYVPSDVSTTVNAPANPVKEAGEDLSKAGVAGVPGGSSIPAAASDKYAAVGTGLVGGAAAIAAAPAVGAVAGTAANAATKYGALYLIGNHVAKELGIPLPKIMDVLKTFKVP